MDYLTLTIELTKKYNEELKSLTNYRSSLITFALFLLATSGILAKVDAFSKLENVINWYWIALLGLLVIIISSLFSKKAKIRLDKNYEYSIGAIKKYQKSGTEMPLEDIGKILKRNIE